MKLHSKSLVRKLQKPPIATAAAAIYPYSEALLESMKRVSVYDKDEVYYLGRATGTEFNRRIWVPRGMTVELGEDLRVDGLTVPFTTTFTARNSEQTRVIKESVALLKAGENFVTEAPPGFGKTYVGAVIIGSIGKKTLVVVNKEDIKDQWVEAFKNVLGLTPGVDLGFLYGDVVDVVGRKVVIAMVQSIAKDARYPEHTFKDFGLAIWDECHRVGADFFSQSCFRVPAKLRLGLSATPDRKDGRSEVIEAHIGPVLVATKASPMTPRVIIQESPWHIPMRRKVDEDGRVVVGPDGKIEMVQIPHSPKACGHIIKMITHHHGRNTMIANFVSQCYASGRKILVQSDTKDHLDMLGSLFGTFGIPPRDISLYIGGLSKDARTKAKTAKVILATFAMTKEATDIPDLDTLVMATPKSDVVQIVGRILRAFDGKKEPLVFDIVDSSSSVFKGYAANRLRWYGSRPETVNIQRKVAPAQIDKPVKSTRMVASK